MRILWLICVLLIIGYTWFSTTLGLADAQSAVQATQLYNSAMTNILAVIAVTLGFWFVADGYERSKASEPETAPVAQPNKEA